MAPAIPEKTAIIAARTVQAEQSARAAVPALGGFATASATLKEKGATALTAQVERPTAAETAFAMRLTVAPAAEAALAQ